MKPRRRRITSCIRVFREPFEHTSRIIFEHPCIANSLSATPAFGGLPMCFLSLRGAGRYHFTQPKYQVPRMTNPNAIRYQAKALKL
jgi:hypothetical protein